MIEPLYIAVPVTAAVSGVVFHLHLKSRLRKFMHTHIVNHTRAMTQLLMTAHAVSKEPVPEGGWTEEAYTKRLIVKGHEFGLALGGIREDGTHITKDNIVSG